MTWESGEQWRRAHNSWLREQEGRRIREEMERALMPSPLPPSRATNKETPDAV